MIAEVRVLQSEVQELFHIVQRLVTVSKKRCNRFDIFRYYGIISFKPDTPKTEAAKTELIKAAASEIKTEVPKVESKKEADPNKEFVDGIMTEMALKGASKKRLIKMLGEQFNFDKQKVLFRLKRALITERYAAAHAEAGH